VKVLASKHIYNPLNIQKSLLNTMSKERFIKIYADLAEDIRKEIIAIVDDKPYTWNSAYVEIQADSELGKKILKKLNEMQII